MAEVILVLALCAAAGGIAFLIWHNNSLRMQAQRDLRETIRHALHTTPIEKFDLGAVLHGATISPAAIEEICSEIYRETYSHYLSDGVIAATERQHLEKLWHGLQLPRAKSRELERSANREFYGASVARACPDGHELLSFDWCEWLNNLRNHLQLSRDQVRLAVGRRSELLYSNAFKQIASRGQVEHQDFAPLAAYRSVLGLTDQEAAQIIRPNLLALYHERFCIAKQDGVITPHEEQELANLQQFLGLSNDDVPKYRQQIDRIKCLDGYRRGRLPTVNSGAILEGGEICHYDVNCNHFWTTSGGRIKQASGRLRVTSNRIIFTSEVRNFEFKPSKVMDLDIDGNGVNVTTTGARGTGRYAVRDAELLEAILYGVVSRHKYITPDSFSSDRTRHIPDDVKRQVWARDGGRCVKCGAMEYLEFDHIIPYTKGGSNSERNIQLLCRKCNLHKSNRI